MTVANQETPPAVGDAKACAMGTLGGVDRGLRALSAFAMMFACPRSHMSSNFVFFDMSVRTFTPTPD